MIDIWKRHCPSCGRAPSQALLVWTDKSKCPWCGARYEAPVLPDVGRLLRDAYVMARRILQSDLYPKLDDEQKRAVDDSIERYMNQKEGT